MNQDYSLKIASSASVSPQAILGKRVAVGHGAIIEAGAEIGDDTHIMPYAFIAGNVRMGRNNYVGHGAILGTDPQDHSFSAEQKSFVLIGNQNIIREYVTIHRAIGDDRKTTLGDHNLLMVGVHLGHNVHVGNHATIANNVLLGGHVCVGDKAVLGGAAIFHQYVRVGELVMVQGGAKISQHIPPYCMAAHYNQIIGINALGLRRAQVSLQDRSSIKKLFLQVYSTQTHLSKILPQLLVAPEYQSNLYTQKFLAFIASSSGAGEKGIGSRRLKSH